MTRTTFVLASVTLSWTFAACAIAAEESEPVVAPVPEHEAAEIVPADPRDTTPRAIEVRLDVPAAGVPVYVPPNRGTTAHRIGGGTRGGAFRH